MKLKRFTILALLALPLCLSAAEIRTEILLEKGWKFTRDDNSNFKDTHYNDVTWESVVVPHDWAIYGPFSINNDKQNTAITQDGQKEAMEHAGRTGGLPFVGTGWYRYPLNIENYNPENKYTLVFDGAMSHARVYINGKQAGYWPYGYNSFIIDATPFLNGAENTLAVRLENSNESSRWYPGAGLYRNVHLVTTGRARVPEWGTQIITTGLYDSYARLHQKTEWSFPNSELTMKNYTIKTEILNPNGKVVAKANTDGNNFSGGNFFEQDFVIENPLLWTPETPNLYTSVSKVYEGGSLKDEYTSTFGIRTVEIRAGEGFFLNGKRVQFKGVCNHHDLGPLGGIANEAGIRRQIRILKDMGCNAIRTSHNMPAPELVKACDEMGMMLMAESFDEWATAKVQNGYHREFNEWVEKDLVNLIRHFRNNPSIVMWCIGNEVPDQGSHDQGPKMALRLQNICHREDPTRPVTNGMDQPDNVMKNSMAAIMDVPGFNYRSFKYVENIKGLPQGLVLGSETASTLSSRGIYKFPVERKAMAKYEDHQASSYDVEHCGWSDLPEDNFIQHDDLNYCIGEFVWTGFDYLGEPTPYYSDWPSHSSLFGIIDLAGLPKDRYYLYRSHWNEDAETLHILPHWNWKGREGEITPIFVYTNYPSAELFINGKSQGKRTKDFSITVDNSTSREAENSFKRQKRYRLMWMDTKYEPGTVKIVAYDKEGNAVAEKEMHTAGKPHHIELEVDRDLITADGKDLAFVTVKVVDKKGNLCPTSDNEISFKVTGNGYYRAGANGDPTSLESFQEPHMKVFSGMMTAIVSSTEEAGKITLEATSKKLKKAKVIIKTQTPEKKKK